MFKKYLILIFVFANTAICNLVLAESKRIEVYENQQQFYDVQQGDSLSLICQRLHEQSSIALSTCMQRLYADNPDAFVNNSIDLLLAGKRLWLPGSYRSVSRMGPGNYSVQKFSWGQIKKPK